MSYMFEVYYKPPRDPKKEERLTSSVAGYGGKLTCLEDAREHTGICLTYEFDDRAKAESAAEALQAHGEHVEGPMDYGP